ncbi:MAG: histidine triad nucleotide-binding protein [Clostridiales bacterium]|nr:histidine triad nucleotide-binding protein [Clostridiales bacterium]
MKDCLFCKIVSGDIPSKKVYEDEKILAFYDISPMAKVHVLVIPKMHISSAQDITDESSAVIGYLFSKIPYIATLLGINESGYRVITNCGEDGCQSVKHIHFHILGGQQLSVNMA